MKKNVIPLLVFIFVSNILLAQKPEYSNVGFFDVPNSGRQIFNFNIGWRFFKGSIENAESVNFNDIYWELVNTPHGLELNPSEASGSINYQGEAWYRKHFTLPKSIENKKLTINFEAVMGKCKVWLNGKLLASHYGGYLPFSVDISDKILKGKENVIAVWTDNSDDPSYPPGKKQTVLDFSYFGGIYRDVWLLATNQVYVTNANTTNKIAGGGLFVHYENLSAKSVNVIAKLDIRNDLSKTQNIHVNFNLKDKDGNIVATSITSANIAAKSNAQTEQNLQVEKPQLWSPKSPTLYSLEVLIMDKNQQVIDGIKQKIGIRKIEFKGEDGFFLNNEPYAGKLMGANRHQDFAYVGNALPNSGQWRDAKLLKEAGCEIIRAAHYPADPAFMDACDALGMFFIVATPGWQFWNNDNPKFQEFVYQDIRNMVRRDRNHPSVLLWEPILNETHYPDYFAEKVHTIVHEEFPYQGAYTACDSRAKGMEHFDVIYDHPQYADKFKVWIPDPKGLKTDHINFDYSHEDRCIFTREWGDNVDDWNSHNSTSRVARGWGESAQLIQANHYAKTKYRFTNWESLSSTPPQHVGGALWHSFDHQRGYHPDPFYGGITDVFRQPKYSYYLFKAQRQVEDSEPMVYIAHEMTPFSNTDVTVFSNCDEVRLIVLQKDTILIKQDREALNMPNSVLVFKNAFDFMDVKRLYRQKRHSEATIIAEGIIDGKVVAQYEKIPANRVTKIKLEVIDKGIPLTANGSDFVTVIASIVDDNGTVKRLNENYIKFEIEGEGNIIGTSEIMANPRKVEWGTAPVLIRATDTPGSITVKASVVHDGAYAPQVADVTFFSIASPIPLIYNEKSSNIVDQATFDNNRNSKSESELKKKIVELEKQLNNYKLKEVQTQQEEFEGKNKRKKANME